MNILSDTIDIASEILNNTAKIETGKGQYVDVACDKFKNVLENIQDNILKRETKTVVSQGLEELKNATEKELNKNSQMYGNDIVYVENSAQNTETDNTTQDDNLLCENLNSLELEDTDIILEEETETSSCEQKEQDLSDTNAIIQTMADVFASSSISENEEIVKAIKITEESMANKTSHIKNIMMSTNETTVDTEEIKSNTSMQNQKIDTDLLKKDVELNIQDKKQILAEIKTEKPLETIKENNIALIEKASKLTEKMLEDAEIKVSQEVMDTTNPKPQIQEGLTETLIKAQIAKEEENNQITQNKNIKTLDTKNTLSQNTNIKISEKDVSTETEEKESETNNNSLELNKEEIISDKSNKTNINQSEQKFDKTLVENIKTSANSSIQTKLTDNVKTNILNQVNAKFEQLKDGTTTKVNIILRPENLGKIGVELVSRPDGLNARILADTQQVKELLDKNIDMLKNSLQSQGVNVNNITIKAVESSQGSEFNTANNFDFLNNEQQQQNSKLNTNDDESFENHRKYDDSEEENEDENTQYREADNPELKEAQRLYSQHSGQVDLVV